MENIPSFLLLGAQLRKESTSRGVRLGPGHSVVHVCCPILPIGQ